MSYVGTSNATSPTLLVTERSRNSTTILSNITNTVASENSWCGIVSVIVCFCFAVVLMIAIGIWHVRKRQIMKTRRRSGIHRISWDGLSISSQFHAKLQLNKNIYKWLLSQWDSIRFERIYDEMNCFVWKGILFWILSFSSRHLPRVIWKLVLC